MIKYHNFIAVLVILLSIIPFWSEAFADCEDIENNSEWKTHMGALESFVEQSDYEGAIESARAMFRICNKSPKLHILTGMAMLKNGENDRAEKYFNRAVELTAEREVTLEEAKLAWYTYYKFMEPKKSAVNETVTYQFIKPEGMNMADSYKTMMWTGVGVGGGGILMTVIGGVLIGVMDVAKDPGELKSGEDYKILKLNNGYVAGWTMLGIGIGLTAVGAALAGYGGYSYSQASKPKKTADNYRWDIGLGSAVFTYQF